MHRVILVTSVVIYLVSSSIFTGLAQGGHSNSTIASSLVPTAFLYDAYFVCMKLEGVTIAGSDIRPENALSVVRGHALIFYFQEGEIVNVAQIYSQKGVLMLETKSLDKTIQLSTENLLPGKYTLKLASGVEHTYGTIIIK
jgi:hypothetical protein